MNYLTPARRFSWFSAAKPQLPQKPQKSELLLSLETSAGQSYSSTLPFNSNTSCLCGRRMPNDFPDWLSIRHKVWYNQILLWGWWMRADTAVNVGWIHSRGMQTEILELCIMKKMHHYNHSVFEKIHCVNTEGTEKSWNCN